MDPRADQPTLRASRSNRGLQTTRGGRATGIRYATLRVLSRSSHMTTGRLAFALGALIGVAAVLIEAIDALRFVAICLAALLTAVVASAWFAREGNLGGNRVHRARPGRRPPG